MKRQHMVSCAAMAAFFAGCASGLSIRTDFDPQVSFAAFETYKWAERTETGDDDPRVYNAITASRVKTAVNRALQAKGLRETSSNPDFIVAWHGAIQGKMEYRTITNHYGYGWGWYGGAGIATTSTTTRRGWDEGTLIIDVIGTRSNQLVWRGEAQARLDDRPPSPALVQRRLDEAAANILANFPPQSGS